MARILVVEDDRDLLFLYETTLSRQGHEITCAPETAIGLTLLAHDKFDLIILDMNMPDISGLKVLEFVNDDPRLCDIPVIVVSANAQYRAQCFVLGVEHFLIKPVPTRQLFAVLDGLLQV